MSFNMNATWQRATALVSANFQLLAVIAGVFLFLPGAAIYLAIPDLAMLMDPTGDPQKVAAQMQGMLGSLMGWGLLALVAQFVGYLAMVAMMGDDRPTVGEAIGRGFKSLPTMVACLILFILAYMVVALVLMVPVTVLGASTGSSGVGVLGVLLILVAIGFLMTRLSVTMPVIMLEGQLNPVTALLRSWRLTGPFKWRLFGFWVLLFLVYLVIAMLMYGIFGMMGALAASSTGSLMVLGIFNGIVGALVAMLVSGIVVAMYQQLAGENPATLSETFE